MPVLSEKLTYGDHVNWVEPKQPGSHRSCVQCGRKVGKNSYMVLISNSGAIILSEDDKNSQGYWPVGRECAKAFAHDVLYLSNLI
jgi:hypothetical protein